MPRRAIQLFDIRSPWDKREGRTIEHSYGLYRQEGCENQLSPLCNDVVRRDLCKSPDVGGGCSRSSATRSFLDKEEHATTWGQLNIVLLCFIFHHLCYETRQHQTAILRLRRGRYPNVYLSGGPKHGQVAWSHRLTAPGGMWVLRVLAQIWDNHWVTQPRSMNRITDVILIWCPL